MTKLTSSSIINFYVHYTRGRLFAKHSHDASVEKNGIQLVEIKWLLSRKRNSYNPQTEIRNCRRNK